MDIVTNVLKERYLKEGEHSYEDMIERVSNALAPNEFLKSKFYNLMKYKRFLPNSPTLMNAGSSNSMLSACFVLPIEDSIESIGTAITDTMIIHKLGGGTGFSFGKVRPRNSKVQSTNGIASGPVSFMKIFDVATEQIKQGGKRRGANMGILPVHHPDIEEFISCKEEDGVLSNFNISVALTDDFLKAVESNEKTFTLEHPKGEKKVVNPRELFEKICYNMWYNGEPGVIFLDTINRNRKCDEYIDATNPCSEQPLIPYGSCNLGSLNVSKYVINGSFNWVTFEEDIEHAVDFLNKVIDNNQLPLPEKMNPILDKYRFIGLGIMGFADALIELGYVYGDENSFKFAEALASFLYNIASEYSRDAEYNNATLISYAPTGTISLIAGCSSGIEPNFAYHYSRNTWVNGNKVTYTQKHPLYDEYYPIRPECFVTASDISPENHLKMQSIFQKYCDSGISKTINIPNNYSYKNIGSLVLAAWKEGCKGFTMYRDGSRDEQVLQTKTENVIDEKKRPPTLYGSTYKIQSGCGRLYITVNEKEGKPYEVFIKTDGSGGCSANLDALGRSLSVALQHGVSVKKIMKQMNKVVCEVCKCNKNAQGKSCASIVGNCLSLGIDEFVDTFISPKNGVICPDCGSHLVKSSGCFICEHCGWSKCL